MIEKKAYAKINLTLEIGEKRADGYHFIKSVMARVSLADLVRVKCNEYGKIRFFTSSDVPADDNLCIRAAKAYFRSRGMAEQGVDIELEANIPTASGMGGGSADAAATLECMEMLFGALDDEVRYGIACSLGSDVPYCLEREPCICTGRGDVCQRLDYTPIENMWLAIEKVGEKISTGKVYSDFDMLEKNELSHNHDGMITALKNGDVRLLADSVFNDFERVVFPFSSQLYERRREMLDSGALNVVMSGAGPTIVGIFDNEALAKKASDSLYKIII